MVNLDGRMFAGEAMLTSYEFWGFVVNILGLLVGIGGVALAIRSHLKLRSARQAVRVTEEKLLHYMASEQFRDMSRDAADLQALLRSRDWLSAAKLASDLQLSLGGGLGGWDHLLSGPERDKIEVARTQVNELVESLPLGAAAEPITDDAIRNMIAQCRFVMDIASEVAGRFSVKYLREPGE